MLINAPLAFVDVETTGMSANFGRIIEVAIHRVENSKLVSSFETLVNPQCKLDPFISTLTNIKQNDLQSAPKFKAIANKLHRMLEGCVFVAHNVEFDYSFLASEFERCGLKYNPQKLCTVKLWLLFPEYERHSLDHIIERGKFKISNRHREMMMLWCYGSSI